MLISASILSADFSQLGLEVQAVSAAGADLIHLDVMDGHFVPNLTFGGEVVRAIRRHTQLPLDAHLMVENPQNYIEEFARAGVNMLTVHAEVSPHLDRMLSQIKESGMQAGVSFTPSTEITGLEYIVDKLDLILIMGVNPGFGGQKLIERQLLKIRKLRKTLQELGESRIKISIDGGVNRNNAPALLEAGCDILVAGSSIFTNPINDGNLQLRSQTYADNIKALRGR